jgi:hypothetical protein
MQLKLDVIAREQSEALARIEERLVALERGVTRPSAPPDSYLGASRDGI